MANFLHFASFGLYEDDWYYIAGAWGMQPRAWFGNIWDTMRHFYLGRPVQEFLLRTLAYLGSACHSIGLLYVLAACLHAASVLMFFRVLRLRYGAFLAALGALLFAISPLSTIRPYLGGTLYGAPGLMFLFAAILVYARPRYRACSYPLAILSLLTYETLFIVFFAAPFFRRGRKRWRAAAIHTAICGLVLIAYLAVRSSLSESRLTAMAEETPLHVAGGVLHYAALYTVSSFQSYAYAAFIAVREVRLEGLFWSLLLALAAAWCMRRLPSAGIRRTARLASPRTRWWLARVLAPALGMLLLGYALAFFSTSHRFAYPLVGRDTRFSLAATMGSSMLVAGILWYPLAICRRHWTRRLAGTATAAFGVLLCAYSFAIQDDYRREWSHMTRLLAGIMELTPDAGPETLLLIHRPAYQERLFPQGSRMPSINYQPHGLQVSFARLFDDYSGPKVLVVYSEEWRTRLGLHPDGRLYWTAPAFAGTVPDAAAPVDRIVLLVEQPDGNLKRVDAPFWVEGHNLIGTPTRESDAPSNWMARRRSRLWPAVFRGTAF